MQDRICRIDENLDLPTGEADQRLDGHDHNEPYRRAPSYVDKILKGASPTSISRPLRRSA